MQLDQYLIEVSLEISLVCQREMLNKSFYLVSLWNIHVGMSMQLYDLYIKSNIFMQYLTVNYNDYNYNAAAALCPSYTKQMRGSPSGYLLYPFKISN